MRPIRKAVFPVAGLGTRFLPATKALPNEMLPVIDKPLIQYAVEEAVAAGITELIFIAGRNKRAIEDHFDSVYELEKELLGRDKLELLETVRHILPDNVNFMVVRQHAPLGLGHAILCAEPLVGNEPFAVILADDLIDAQVPAILQLVQAAHQYQGSILGVTTIPAAESDQYGVVTGRPAGDRVLRVEHIVEKPAAPGVDCIQGVAGRYVLESGIFDCLRQCERGANGEYQLTDGIALLLETGSPVYSYRYEGTRYDCGSKQGLFSATIAMGKKYHGLQV
ncbi:UTP--glucose-1-phosphate uridylyltransferase [Orrella sp. JC864]|uniref:UTP--glucose-1-phosphate uridylyltransferase n=1 Tax=Orrella sp. JC864 TaxID=3120298 RepID=UPI003009969D